MQVDLLAPTQLQPCTSADGTPGWRQMHDAPFHRQARQQDHAVSIWKCFGKPIGIAAAERLDGLFPVSSGLKQQQDIGLPLLDQPRAAAG